MLGFNVQGVALVNVQYYESCTTARQEKAGLIVNFKSGRVMAPTVLSNWEAEFSWYLSNKLSAFEHLVL